LKDGRGVASLVADEITPKKNASLYINLNSESMGNFL
jgi:hypothetical protein